MPVQLYYVQLSTNKTNVSDLSSAVFEILISFTRTIQIQNPLQFHKFSPKLANKGSTELYCLFIADDSIAEESCSVIPKQSILKSGSDSSSCRNWNKSNPEQP